MPSSFEIRSALGSLIGEDALEQYEQDTFAALRDNPEYWGSVNKQTAEDLKKLDACISWSNGVVGFSVFPQTLDVDAETFFPLLEKLADVINELELSFPEDIERSMVLRKTLVDSIRLIDLRK
jgi:hypothetical protein